MLSKVNGPRQEGSIDTAENQFIVRRRRDAIILLSLTLLRAVHQPRLADRFPLRPVARGVYEVYGQRS